MDLIKHYIKQILYEKVIIPPEWDLQREWVEVKINVDCCGTESVDTKVYPKEEWEQIKEKGYYLG